jgi:hypothetical protein
MPTIRIVTAGALLSIVLFVSGTVTGSATAQTAAAQPAGKPLQLLKVVEQPGKSTAKPNRKVAVKRSTKHTVKVAARGKTHTHIATAGRKRPLLAAQAAAAPAPDSIWPGPDAAAAISQPVAEPTEPVPSEVVVAGQTVQLAAPDEVNAIDLAANDHAATASDTAQAGAAAVAPPTSEVADAELKADSLKAAPAQPQSSPVGSTSWILQVMAALGGAVTAGSLAWFLIGSTPQRMYG